MTRRLFAMLLVLCMAVSVLGVTASAAETLRDDLSGVLQQKDTTGKWTNQEVERLIAKLPQSAASPADVGDNEFGESEPNDKLSDANVIYNDYTVYGTIEGEDVDGYVFELDEYSQVTIVSACTTDGLLYGIYDVESQELVAESGYLGQDEDTGLYMDGMSVELPEGIYCLIFIDYYEASLEYMFYIEIAEVQHTHSYSVEVVEATCTEGGYSIYTCACGDSYMDNETAALGHDFTNAPVFPHENGKQHCWDCNRCEERRFANCTFTGKVTKEPTTTEEGVKTYTCDICGNSYTESIPKLEDEENKIPRISGKNRVATSFEVADALKEALGISKFGAILIANGDNFADALAGSYLASEKNAPILLYRPGFEDEILDYIQENLTQGGKVYILGGTGAVPQVMEDTLAGLTVKRLSGSSRFETNMKILEEGNVTGEEILIAKGWDFADCLSASATGLPVLMVNTTAGKLTDSQIAFLQAHSENTYTIIGGTGAVSDELKAAIEEVIGREVSRVYGKSREATSVEVARTYFDSPDYVLLAYSRNFPDGLCGGPLAHAMGAPLLLVNSGKEADAAAYVKENGIESGAILGGTAAVSEKSGRIVFGLE